MVKTSGDFVVTELKEGVYRAKVTEQYMSVDKDGNPQLFLSVKLVDKYNNPFNASDGISEISDDFKYETRSIQVNFPPNDAEKMGWSIESLMSYGFDPNMDSENILLALHHEAPPDERFSLVGSVVAVKLKRSPDNRNPGQFKEWWNLVKTPSERKVSMSEFTKAGSSFNDFIKTAVERAKETAPF